MHASHRIRCPLDTSPSCESTGDTSIAESRRYTPGLKPSLSILSIPGAEGTGPPAGVPDTPSSPVPASVPVRIRVFSPANRTGLISTWGESAGSRRGSSQRSC